MASLNDRITETFNGQNPTSTTASLSRAIGGTSLTGVSLAGWPTNTAVHFATYQKDSTGAKIAGTQTDWKGVVSGSTINSLTRQGGAADGGNGIGDIIEMMPTYSWANDLAAGLELEHDTTGKHTSAAAVTLGKLLFPIGFIFTEITGTNPGITLGFGTWVAFGAGRVLVGNGTSDQIFTAGSTGGESNHTLTTNEMPAHTHSQTLGGSPRTATSGSGTVAGSANSDTTGSTGGGASHNNLQPYIVVYFWKRTA